MSIALIQCASGRFTDVQAATIEHHRKYCLKHGINYLVHFGRVQTMFDAMWDKIVLCLDSIRHNEHVVWLDSDCLIVDPNTSLESAFSEFQDIGMCRHHTEGWKTQSWHYNAGAIYMRSTTKTGDFLKKTLERGIVKHATWHVQATLLTVNDAMNIIEPIDDKWNSTVNTNISPNPVVESWHGHNQDFGPLLVRLSQCTTTS